MRKLLLLISFFSFTPIFLIAASVLLLSVTFHDKSANSMLGFLLTNPQTSIAYAALPTNLTMEADVSTSDARVANVLAFLEAYNSPLAPYAATIVADADRNGINYRLVPAIALQETTGCQKAIPGTLNCWGFGVYGHKVTSFTSYEDAIDTISRYLANKKQNGFVTVKAIGSIWNPSNSDDWVGKVTYFMSQI